MRPLPAAAVLAALAAASLAPPLATRLGAQPAAEADVRKAVARLFDAMRAGDSAGVRAAFHPQALLGSAIVRNGQPEFRVDTIDGFVKAVGTPHPQMWDERVT